MKSVLVMHDTTFSILTETFWPEFQVYFALGEQIGFNKISINYSNNYFELTNNKYLKYDSIYVGYGIVNDDVGILGYELDIKADNKLEIISFDKQSKKLKAIFKASFIGRDQYPPDLPKHVRFVDTYIEIGY